MALIRRTNGSGSTNLIGASWWNDFMDLLTGVMQDQEVSIKNVLILQAIGAAPSTGPTAAPASGTGMGIGSYAYVYTYANADGESLASPAGSMTTTSGNQQGSVSGITVGPTGTTARKLYRTAVGGGTNYKLVTTINDNTTTTYTDSTADASLGAAVPTAPSFGGALIIKDQTGAVKFKINNDGSFSAGGTTGFGSTTINGTLTVASNGQTLTESVLDSSGNAAITASGSSGSIKLGYNGTNGNVLDAYAFGTTYVKGASNVQVQVPSGSNVVNFTSGGLQFNAGGLKFTNNQTLGQVGTFTGTGSGTYNHPINGVPDMVIPIVTAASSSATQGFNGATSTQVTVTLGASMSFKAYCMKG